MKRQNTKKRSLNEVDAEHEQPSSSDDVVEIEDNDSTDGGDDEESDIADTSSSDQPVQKVRFYT